MKNLLILIFSFLFLPFSQSQIYNDALELAKYYENADGIRIISLDKIERGDVESLEKVIQILSKYSTEDTENIPALMRTYSKNPFFKVHNSTHSKIPQSVSNTIGLAANTVASSSPLSVTSFADGLAKFLVKRTKQELNEAFFKKFQKKMQEDSTRLDLLFPQTYGSLTLIGTDIYQFNAYMETLRSAFIDDLTSLTYNAEKWLKSEEIFSLFDGKNAYVKSILSDIFHLSSLVQNGENATNILMFLAKDAQFLTDENLPDEVKKYIQKFHAAIQFIEQVAASLRSKEYKKNWIDTDKFIHIKENKKLRTVFLGLLYQRIKDVDFGNGNTLEKIITEAEIEKYTQLLLGLISETHRYLKLLEGLQEKINSSITEIKDDFNTQEKHLFYSKYVSRTFDLIYSGIDKIEAFDVMDSEDILQAKKYLKTAQDASDMGVSILKGEYGLAVLELVNFINLYISEENKVKPFLVKYGSFMASVAKAKNSDEVAETIEAFALPPGSSSIKKYAHFNASLSAYVGAAGGIEFLSSDNDWSSLSAKGTIAFSAPVGVSLSWGTPKNRAVGFFASLIDIGALTAFRFKDAQAELLPELKFKNIVAPGFYFMYHLGNDLPLSLGIGGQFGPNLRKIEVGTQETINAQGFRLGATFSVDIPIFNIYTNPRENK